MSGAMVPDMFLVFMIKLKNIVLRTCGAESTVVYASSHTYVLLLLFL